MRTGCRITRTRSSVVCWRERAWRERDHRRQRRHRQQVNGGATWTRLNWLLGFKQLGCQTFFVEQIARAACVDADGRPAAFRESANLAWFRHVAATFGFNGTLILDDGSDADGLSFAELAEIAAQADLLVNISGHLRLPALCSRFRSQGDLDPGFTQFWHASRNAGAHLEGHDPVIHGWRKHRTIRLHDSNRRHRLDADAPARRARVVAGV